MLIREETPEDIAVIRAIHVAAFANHPYSQQTEHLIVEALREDGALKISLVAEKDGVAIGHIAFSPMLIGGQECGWHPLGPIGVLPGEQREGIGSALVSAGLAELRSRTACGCALVGDPAFYGRFGFTSDARLTYEGVPQEHVLQLALNGETPSGEITHHAAFGVEARE